MSRLVTALAFCIASLLADAAAALPTVSGFDVTVYGTATDPMRMTFDADGTLYVGRDNVGSGGDFGDAVKLFRIPIGGGTGQEFGAVAIPDPDSVVYDAAGIISGVPGSVLVGGGGGLFAVHPDQSVVQLFSPAQILGDIDAMEFDSTGRLVMISGQDTLKQTTGGAPSVFVNVVTSTPVSMALGADDSIYLGGLSGTVSIYSDTGALVQADLLSGIGANPRVAIGRGGFGTGLYVMTNDGDLYSVATDGTKTLFASGFAQGTVMTAGSWIAFGPDQALYVAEFPHDRILRVAVPLSVPEPATLTLLLLGGGLLAGAHRRLAC